MRLLLLVHSQGQLWGTSFPARPCIPAALAPLPPSKAHDFHNFMLPSTARIKRVWSYDNDRGGDMPHSWLASILLLLLACELSLASSEIAF